MTTDVVIFVPADYFRELRKDELFADASRPLEVDLGCGDGLFLAQMAKLFPERNFFGVERMAGRVDKTARRIVRRRLENARVLRLDSVYVVAWLLPAASVSRLHVLCPDPWPKKRHHGHRLFSDAEFVAGLHRVLVRDGELLLKTDDADYFASALESMAQQTSFTRLDWPDDGFPYPPTTFEKRWTELGKIMHRARWRFGG